MQHCYKRNSSLLRSGIIHTSYLVVLGIILGMVSWDWNSYFSIFLFCITGLIAGILIILYRNFQKHPFILKFDKNTIIVNNLSREQKIIEVSNIKSGVFGNSGGRSGRVLKLEIKEGTEFAFKKVDIHEDELFDEEDNTIGSIKYVVLPLSDGSTDEPMEEVIKKLSEVTKIKIYIEP